MLGRLKLILGVCVLAAAIGGGYAVSRLLNRSAATEARLNAEATEFATATGISQQAARQIVDMGQVRLGQVASAEQLSDTLMSFERFQGEDRRKVAQYCVAYLVAPGLHELEPDRKEVAQIAIKSILTEFAEDGQIVGVAYATAASLGLREDPYVISLANQTLVSSTVADGPKRFVARAMFPLPSPATSTTTENPP